MYYFDDNLLIYNQCYISCKSCNSSGNETLHNCIECKEEYEFEFEVSDYKNCFTDINNYITNKTEYMINNLIKKLDISDIDSGNDKKIKDKNTSIIMTSTKNQKKNENEEMVTIDLCGCEDILKNEYNISKNDSLYILQIISEEEGMKIPIIEYEVYYPTFKNNLTKLNLTLCKGTKIDISIPVKINDSLDKYNPKSDYYNDVCSKTTSESGTDISLKDRRNEFVDNNMTLCEANCDLISYNYSNEKVKCSFDVKTSVNPNHESKFNKNEFFKSFIDIKNIANINVLKCYKIVLNFKNLINNYGFLIISPIMMLNIISIFIYRFKSYKKFKRDLFNMSLILCSIEPNEFQPNIKEKKNIIKKKFKKIQSIKKRKINNSKRDSFIKINKTNKNSNLNVKMKKKLRNDKIKTMNNNRQTTLNNKNKTFNTKNIIKNLKLKLNNLNIKYIKELLEKKDFELNSLNYGEALKIDKRNYFQYYFSLLKNGHPLFFSFGIFNDYNSHIIKIFLFFSSFSSDLTINALFFNDDTMHKIYQDRGKYDLLFQIPQILYSTLISKFIDTLIKNLALSQDDMLELKQEKRKTFIKKKYIKILKILRIKIVLFFIFSFIILSSFWYYLTCFCGIYVNTQMHVINDSVSSLLTSFIFPFAINLIPGLYRIPGLRIKKACGRCLYRFSSFLENYFV